MLHFIGLTTTYGTRIWVNPEKIVKVEPMKGNSVVSLSGPHADMIVTENPDQIMELIKEEVVVNRCRNC